MSGPGAADEKRMSQTAQNSAQAAALHSLGLQYFEQGRYNEAIAHFRSALALQPDSLRCELDLAVALHKALCFADAATHYRNALAIEPNAYEVRFSLGNVLAEDGRMEEARVQFEIVNRQMPSDAVRVRLALLLPVIYRSHDDLVANRLRQQRQFDELAQSVLHIDESAIEGLDTNFYLAYQGFDDRHMQVQLANIYARACPSLLWVAPHCRRLPSFQPGSRPLRIGFVSRHLRFHSVGLAVQGLITSLSPGRFWTAAFGNAVAGDSVSEIIRNSVDQYVELPAHTPAARELLASYELDLLIFPDIGMDPVTYFLGFARLAPVQCVMWGHSSTTGIANMDYFISHADVETQGADVHYSEALVRIGRPTFPALAQPAMPASPMARRDFGLPEDATLYVCPQSLFKLHPDFDPLAREILRRDPRGRLVLIAGMQPHWTELLKQRFEDTLEECADRVIFLKRMGNPDHFRGMIAACDVMLDSIHVGGGITSLDGFSAGTPIVTFPGTMMRTRFTAAWCRLLEVEECIADSAEQYVALALRLAQDGEFRVSIRNRIRNNRHRLFDDESSVQEFEDFFESAYAKMTAGAA
jgi:predicted O-linked N-acetylglucosamine transferase (SPINDLY family)